MNNPADSPMADPIHVANNYPEDFFVLRFLNAVLKRYGRTVIIEGPPDNYNKESIEECMEKIKTLTLLSDSDKVKDSITLACSTDGVLDFELFLITMEKLGFCQMPSDDEQIIWYHNDNLEHERLISRIHKLQAINVLESKANEIAEKIKAAESAQLGLNL